MAITPNQNDVLLGRGLTLSRHPGNKQYRQLVEHKRGDYLNATRKVKRMIARGIVEQIFAMEPPGRFLESSGEVDGCWICVEKDKAIEKVMHRFRDHGKRGGKSTVADGNSVLLAGSSSTEAVSSVGLERGSSVVSDEPSQALATCSLFVDDDDLDGGLNEYSGIKQSDAHDTHENTQQCTSGRAGSAISTNHHDAGVSINADLVDYDDIDGGLDEYFGIKQTNAHSFHVNTQQCMEGKFGSANSTNSNNAGLSTDSNLGCTDINNDRQPNGLGLENEIQQQMQKIQQLMVAPSNVADQLPERPTFGLDQSLQSSQKTDQEEHRSNRSNLNAEKVGESENYWGRFMDGGDLVGGPDEERKERSRRESDCTSNESNVTTTTNTFPLQANINFTFECEQLQDYQKATNSDWLWQQQRQQCLPSQSHLNQQNPPIHPSTSQPSIALSLRDWLNGTSHRSPLMTDFLSRTIDMAILLTKQLAEKVDDSQLAAQLTASRMSSPSIDAANLPLDSYGFASGASALNEGKHVRGSEPSIEPPLIDATKTPFLRDVAGLNIYIRVHTSGRDLQQNQNSNTSSCYIDSIELQLEPISSYTALPALTLDKACYVLGRIMFDLLSKGQLCAQDFETKRAVSTDDDEPVLSFDELMEAARTDGGPDEPCNINKNAAWQPSQSPSLLHASTEHRNLSTDPATGEEDRSKRRMKNIMTKQSSEILLDLGMPISICRLVSDLLASDSTVSSLELILHELDQMKRYPNSFLFDRTSPDQAMDDILLFKHNTLYGREDEIALIHRLANKVDTHAAKLRDLGDEKGPGFHCEAAFLSGHSGAGKSTLLNHSINSYKSKHWHVIECNFDSMESSMVTFARSFDKYLAAVVNQRNTLQDYVFQKSVDQICQSILSIDEEGLDQLCCLMPSISLIGKSSLGNSRRQLPYRGTNDKAFKNIELERHRLLHLFHSLVLAICSGKCPVLLVLDNLQWADNQTLDIIRYFVESNENGSIFLLGSVRHDEDYGERILGNYVRSLENVGVTKILIDGLSTEELNKILSSDLHLPIRLTTNLANIVHKKTRGNPFFVVEFMKSLIDSELLKFSVKKRRWTWDQDEINMKEISNGVAELITKKLVLVPVDVRVLLEKMSCLGSFAEESVLAMIHDSESVQNSMQTAVHEGLVEKAESMYAFSHDIVKQAIYGNIPINFRNELHKVIGITLLEASTSNEAEVRTLSIQQINIIKNENILSPQERLCFAKLNLETGKRVLSSYSFGRAYSYFESGISMLDDDHWNSQYSLSLELFELSATTSFVTGSVETLKNRLNEIISRSKSFDDSFNANVILVKSLFSNGQVKEAMEHGLGLLSQLGESAPKDITVADAKGVAIIAQATLQNVTIEQFLSFPKMNDKKILKAINLLSVLCIRSSVCKPLLLPFLSFRIIQLSIDYGCCECTIVGLVFIGRTLIQLIDDIPLAYRLAKIADSLSCWETNQHHLQSVLCLSITSTKIFVEPVQSLQEMLLNCYNSCMLAGDFEMAVRMLWSNCIVGFLIGVNLRTIASKLMDLSQMMERHKHKDLLLCVSSIMNACNILNGTNVVDFASSGVSPKSFQEICAIAEKTQNQHTATQNNLTQVFVNVFQRNFSSVLHLLKKNRIQVSNTTTEHVLLFFEGLAAFNLMRSKNQHQLRSVGEAAIKKLKFLAEHSKWNFEHKTLLLEAELQYANRNVSLAITLYESAIKSAHMHRFLHEEALAYEMYAFFCLEQHANNNSMSMKESALTNFEKAHGKYIEWGAMKKAQDIEKLMSTVALTSI